MIHQQRASCGRLLGRVKGAGERLEYCGNVLVQVTDFAGDSSNHFTLIWRKVWEGLRAFRMLYLSGKNLCWTLRRGRITNLLPISPYIVMTAAGRQHQGLESIQMLRCKTRRPHLEVAIIGKVGQGTASLRAATSPNQPVGPCCLTSPHHSAFYPDYPLPLVR